MSDHGCEILLINGVLTEAEWNVPVDLNRFCDRFQPCHFHVVNLSPSSALSLSFRFGPELPRSTVCLAFGGTVLVDLPADVANRRTWASTLTLEVEPMLPTLNLTEKLFASEVRQVLTNTAAATISSSSNNTTAAAVEGAASMTTISGKCSTRRPAHAPEVISSMADVNAFDGQGGEKLCVAKKRSKPRSLQICPTVEIAFGIDAISRRAAGGEAMWRQCAASFSTMMRHFQKSPSLFKWEADAERRTIITKAAV